MERIMEVISVDLKIWKSNPSILDINCKGTVPTSGWSNGQLSPYIYIQPPQDGIYDFDFIAEPPKGPALQVISRINANYQWQSFPSDLKGVRVHARNNAVEALLTKQTIEVSFEKRSKGGESPRGIFEFDQSRRLTFLAVILGRETPTLFVNGLVLTSHEDDQITVERAEPQGINPDILILNLKVKQGGTSGRGVIKPFTYQESTTTKYHQVTMNYRNESVTVDVHTLYFPEILLETEESKKDMKEAEMAH